MIRKVIITIIGISNNPNLSGNFRLPQLPFFLLLAMTPENPKSLCNVVIQHFSYQKQLNQMICPTVDEKQTLNFKCIWKD